MATPAHDPRDETTVDLVSRLVDDARAYARAEIDLYKQIAKHRAAKAKSGLVALVAGGLALWFAAVSLILGLVLGLATLIGPLGAGLVVAAVLGIVGYFLLRTGIAGLDSLGGDDEEREALTRGEINP